MTEQIDQAKCKLPCFALWFLSSLTCGVIFLLEFPSSTRIQRTKSKFLHYVQDIHSHTFRSSVMKLVSSGGAFPEKTPVSQTQRKNGLAILRV